MSSIADQFLLDSQSLPSNNAQTKSISDQFNSDANLQPISPEQKSNSVQNFLGGVSHGMVTMAGNAKQGWDSLANAMSDAASGTSVGNAIKYASDKLGLPTASQAANNTNQFLAENKKYGAIIDNTTAGKAGDILGSMAAVAPAALIPGANTYLGSALIGGGLGAATTEGGASDRAIGAGTGAIGGLVGQGIGNLIGSGAARLGASLEASNAAAKSQNSIKDNAIQLAQQHGYVLPPQDVNPNSVNAVLNGISGKIKTSQAASQSNQDVTNALIKADLGIHPDSPLSLDALNAVRNQAGQAYNQVRNAGVVTPGDSYTQALDKIAQQSNGQAKSFPGLKNDEITNVINTLRQTEFNASDAVDATSFLRNLADKSYASGDKATGAAYKQASSALEDALDSHLQSAGNANALQNFRDARQTIAKTYSVQNALNTQNGNVDALKLATQLQKGAPLSGRVQQIAQVASNFPKAMQSLKENYQPFSPLDYMTGVATGVGSGVISGNPLAAIAGLAPAARPIVRSAILSKPVQSLNANSATDYTGGLTSKYIIPALQNNTLGDLIRVGGISSGIQLSK